MKNRIKNYCFNNFNGTPEEYFEIVHSYIRYYHIKASGCKYGYYILSILKIIALAMILAVQSMDIDVALPWIAAVSSVLCLAIEAVIEILRLKDKWILYRNFNNLLMSEQRKYVMKEGVYGEVDDSFRLFVKNAETIMNDESGNWYENVKEQRDIKSL